MHGRGWPRNGRKCRLIEKSAEPRAASRARSAHGADFILAFHDVAQQELVDDIAWRPLVLGMEIMGRLSQITPADLTP